MKPLLYLTWRDSYGASPGWERLDEFTASPLVVESVGFSVYEDDQLLCLAGSYAPESEHTAEQANGIITIPKCSIVSRKEITSLT